MQSTQTESRRFSVHPSIIFDLIQSQAGSLAKAVCENVINALDAEATKIEIKVDQSSIDIVDNGIGFRSRDEILSWFEVFGFPHDDAQHRSKIGVFGIGRAQLWVFASTVWRTNQFSMDVNIKKRGLDYDLQENLPPVRGVAIKGRFYDGISLKDLIDLERELRELVLYLPIKVLFNGRELTVDPKTEKWDHETEDAYIRIKEKGDLVIFNMGMLVTHYSSYKFGVGGVVLTKPGKRLALNMARTDITASCTIWPRIRSFLKAKANADAAKKGERMSDQQRAAIAVEFLSGEIDPNTFAQQAVFTDVIGRNRTMADMAYRARRTMERLTSAPKGSVAGEIVHKAGHAYVLRADTLDRFNCSTVSELVAALKNAGGLVFARHFDRIELIDDISVLTTALDLNATIVPEKEYKPLEKAALSALRGVQASLVQLLINAGAFGALDQNHWQHVRALQLGASDALPYWTDGARYIAIERRELGLAACGLGGMLRIVRGLMHEYLHREPAIGSHTHDLEFFEKYTEVLASGQDDGASSSIDGIAIGAYRRFIDEANKAGLRITRRALNGSAEVDSIVETPEAEESSLDAA